MTNNILTTALALPDQELLARIDSLAGKERETTVELVAHLAALELRRSVYAALGYGSLYAYCTQALRLSEDAACNRIDAARICRRFPGVLDLLAAGAISLSTIRLLKPHLTAENQEALLTRATNRGKKEIEALIAEIAPRPDVPSSIRKLPSPTGDSLAAMSSDDGLFEAAGIPGADVDAPREQRPTSGLLHGGTSGRASPYGHASTCSDRVAPDGPPDRPAPRAAPLPGAVHDRRGGARGPRARAGPAPPRDTDGRRRRNFRASLTVAA